MTSHFLILKTFLKKEKLMPEKNEIVIYTIPEGKETFINQKEHIKKCNI